MADNLKVFGLNYSNIQGIKVIDENDNELTYSRQPIAIPDTHDPAPVRLIDYDGTVLYEYSAADFLALNAMPANPSHTGMTANGWNWSLADAQAYVNAYGALDIGQQYVETQIDITLDNALSPYLSLGVNGTVTINWGDGTTSSVTGTSLTVAYRTQHTYATGGDYTISVTVDSGSFGFYCAQYTPLLSNNNTSSAMITDLQYSSSVKAVRIGSNVSRVGNYSFAYCSALRGIVIPNTIVSLGSDIIQYNYGVSVVSLPKSVTSFGQRAFEYARALERLTLPYGLQSMPDNMIYDCQVLKYIIIPTSVTTIGASNFYNCWNLKQLNFPDTVTAIGNYIGTYFYALQSITMPSGLLTIGSSFMTSTHCLKSIVIPVDVISIGGSFLASSGALTSVTLYPTTPPTLGTSAFNGINTAGLKIYVPSASLSAYQTATNWSAFASNMVGY